jgi:hypothetical protein
MTTTDRISRVFLKLTSPSWPDPANSIGTFCRDLGSRKCWELTGPGLLQYQSLAKDVKRYLEQHSETETAIVHWTAYMVGRSTTSANPTVFFCSPQAAPRRRVRGIVDRSGILQRYPGFRTGDSTIPPGLTQLVTLAGSDNIKSVSSTRTCTCECPTGEFISIHSAQSDQATHHAQNVATVGAIFLFGGTLCFTTAAHAFRTEDIGFDSQEGADFEFDLGDDESDGEVGSECVSSGLQQTSDLRYSTTPALKTSPVQPEDESQSVPQSGSQDFFNEEEILFSSLGTDNPFLDYVLVKLKLEDPRLMQTKTLRMGSCDYHSAIPTTVASSNRGGAVKAFTGSGQVISGTLSEAPSFMTSISCQVTQELWTVKFDVKLARGVCGSMVVDSAMGEYVGHIIAGDPLSGSALIVPAADVLDDVRKRSRKILSLAHGTESVQSQSRLKLPSTLPREAHPEVSTTTSDDKEPLPTSDGSDDSSVILDMEIDPEVLELQAAAAQRVEEMNSLWITQSKKPTPESGILNVHRLLDDLERDIRALLPDLPFQREHVNALDVLTEESLEELKEVLESDPLTKPWSASPRLYALLRVSAGVGEEDLTQRWYTHDELLTCGLSDYALPFTWATLPTVISEQADTARRLLNLQRMVKSSPESMSFIDGILTHRNSKIPPFKPTPQLPVTQGSFGEVESVIHPRTGFVFARKTMRRSCNDTMSENQAQADRQWRLEHFKNEVEILQKLDHEHLVRFCGSYTDENAFALLVQPVAERTLHDLLFEPTPLSMKDSAMLLKSFGCLAFGLAWLHSKLIRHKDIKPANILISAGSMLFCDFGSAMDAELLDTTRTEGPALMRTPRYISPETHEGKPRNEASDIWSLGCVFLEMLTVLSNSSVDELLGYIHHEVDRPGLVQNVCYWEGASSNILQFRIAQIAEVPEVQLVADWTGKMVSSTRP